MSDLAELLVRHRGRLVSYFSRKGRGLAAYESPEDLAQGVHLHAVAHRESFRYLGERAFVAWMLRVARQHLSRRLSYWLALKRDAGPMLRITFGARTPGRVSAGVQPEAPGRGPVTHASMREQVDLAALALDGLPPRDRELVRRLARDESVAEIARALDISAAAAQRARLRAVERFRKIYELLERGR